jgi:hypothetical protein
MPVEELFSWLSQKNRTGMLTVKRAGVTKTFTVENLGIINAASTDAREYFGQFLINFGLVTEDQLQKAFETQLETRILIGKILVMTGLLSEEQIQQMLQLKIRETTLDIFLWDQGTFNFQDGMLPDVPAVVEVAVELKALCTEGAARRQQFAEIRKLIPDNSSCFICQKGTIPPDLDPKSADSMMVKLAHQGYSAADIILKFHSLDFPILKNLAELVRRGWLAVTSGKAPTQDAIPEPDLEVPAETKGDEANAFLVAAQEAIKRRDYEAAEIILKRGLVDHPYDPDLCDALELADKGLAEALRSDLLSDKRVPYLLRDDVLQISSNWTPAQRYILSRIDGQRNVRSIIMVSPLKEVEALKTFRSLIKAGLVGLR